ncbi:MAG TPA: phosphatidate cytidylyltransferase [Gammaproteobacteria bacterium]|nr:phosphatidate cytidylyltransferase [Candidatus Parabeggiatoa sp.]HAI69741.1 phosphatidate cytidylyltransferase [Gammaproteobacteria bacterium]
MFEWHIKSSLLWASAGIILLLILGTVIIAFLTHRYPAKDFSELRARLRSWWWMAGIFILAMLIDPVISLVLFGFLSFLALKEYLSLIPTRRADRRVLFWAYLAIPVQYYWIGIAWYGVFIIFIPIYMFLLLPIRMILIGETEGFLRAAGTLHWGLMTTVFCLSHAAYFLALPEQGNPIAGGAGLLLFLVFLTEFNDISQYVWGKLFGKHKIIPKVSPNKTWEGFLGGLLTTTLLAALVAPWLTPLILWQSVFAGVLIASAGFFGDVSISALKRDLAIKDSGSLLPGHGGILDRVDSLTYTAPLFFHFVYYLHY